MSSHRKIAVLMCSLAVLASLPAASQASPWRVPAARVAMRAARPLVVRYPRFFRPWMYVPFDQPSSVSYAVTYPAVVAPPEMAVPQTNLAYVPPPPPPPPSDYSGGGIQVVPKTIVVPSAPEGGAASTETALPPVREDAMAVVIGTDYSGREDVPELRYATSDAKKVYDVITDPRYGGVPKENTVLLLGSRANKEEISSALQRIRNWNGYVFVYFSGHGAPDIRERGSSGGYLVPDDADVSNPESLNRTAVSMSQVRELLDRSRAKAVLVAVDACFTGTGKSVMVDGAKPLVGFVAPKKARGFSRGGRVILTASTGNQASWEDRTELHEGIFTHYLLGALKGKAGSEEWVNSQELVRYVKTKVPQAAERLKGVLQVPQAVGGGIFKVARNWRVLEARYEEAARAESYEGGNEMGAGFHEGGNTGE